MPFKSIVRDLLDKRAASTSMAACTTSRGRPSCLQPHHRPLAAQETHEEGRQQMGNWANLPPELLLDILRRVESCQVSWPARLNVVACAAVCRNWREFTKEVVKSPEKSGRLTFPISLKQPGPRDFPIQCYIRRERATSTYGLYLGLSPSLQEKNDKLLLAARKIRHATSADFIISLDSKEFLRASCSYVGKLRSNFLGTKFTIYDAQPHCLLPTASCSNTSRSFHAKQVSPRLPSRNYNMATIAYELNVLRGQGPRRMLVTMQTIPVSALQETGSAPTPTDFFHSFDKSLVEFSSTSLSEPPAASTENSREPLVLKNKAPRWHEQLQCWCLNFKGRVTVASVKNFQLVAAVDSSHIIPPAEQEKVILQFGKIGKDIFTMDYRYPLSAFQSFAICLSSFDTKPACE